MACKVQDEVIQMAGHWYLLLVGGPCITFMSPLTSQEARLASLQGGPGAAFQYSKVQDPLKLSFRCHKV